MDSLERTLILARAALSPSTADDERARRALGLRPNVFAASTTAAVHRSGVWAAIRASNGARVAIAALLVGLGFAGGYWIGRREAPVPTVTSLPAPPPPAAADAALDRRAQRPAASPMPAQFGIEPSAPLEGPSEGAREAPAGALNSPGRGGTLPPARVQPSSSQAPARAARARSEGAARPLDPTEELALLRRIEKSLRSDEPALALALLGELEERFPETGLREERAAAAVLVHCALRDPGAQRRAEEFLNARSSSVYADRVRSSCLPEGRAP